MEAEAVKDPKAARLAELRAAKADREKARAEAQADRELEELELEQRFSKELGVRGVDFAIVDYTHVNLGFVVVKPGGTMEYRRYMAKAEASTKADLDDLVVPCVVHPDATTYRRWAEDRGSLPDECAKQIMKLHGVKFKGDAGKS